MLIVQEHLQNTRIVGGIEAAKVKGVGTKNYKKKGKLQKKPTEKLNYTVPKIISGITIPLIFLIMFAFC